jgi:predicted ABC-type ATPase
VVQGRDPALVERLNTRVFSGTVHCRCSTTARRRYKLEERAGDLPLADKGRTWDGAAAKTRMLDAATTDGKISRSKAARGFCAVLETAVSGPTTSSPSPM